MGVGNTHLINAMELNQADIAGYHIKCSLMTRSGLTIDRPYTSRMVNGSMSFKLGLGALCWIIVAVIAKLASITPTPTRSRGR